MPQRLLPDRWQHLKLGMVCSLPERQVRPHEFQKYEYYVGLEDIESGTGRIIEYRNVQEAELKSSKFSFDSSCILYGKLRPYLNKVAIPEVAGICSTDILPLRPNTSIISKDFLYFFLRSPHFVKTASGKSTGANLPRITPGSLMGIQVPLPPIETQVELAQILLKADQLLQKRNGVSKLTSKIIQSVFLRIFGDPDSNPHGFPTATLGDLAVMSRYGPRFYNQPYSESGVPILRTTDITEEGDLSLKEAPRLDVSTSDLERYRLWKGDVVISRSGSLGRCAVFDAEGVDCIPGAFLLHFRFGEEVLPEYIHHYVLSPAIQRRIHEMGRFVAQPNVNAKELKSLLVPVPPIDSQRRFVEIIAAFQRLKRHQEESSHEVNEVFHSLVQRAFSGQLVT